MENINNEIEKLELTIDLYKKLSLFFEDKTNPVLVALGRQLVNATSESTNKDK